MTYNDTCTWTTKNNDGGQIVRMRNLVCVFVLSHIAVHTFFHGMSKIVCTATLFILIGTRYPYFIVLSTFASRVVFLKSLNRKKSSFH